MCVWWKVQAMAICVFVRKICVTQAPACWSPSIWMWRCVSVACSPSFYSIPCRGYSGKAGTTSGWANIKKTRFSNMLGITKRYKTPPPPRCWSFLQSRFRSFIFAHYRWSFHDIQGIVKLKHHTKPFSLERHQLNTHAQFSYPFELHLFQFLNHLFSQRILYHLVWRPGYFPFERVHNRHFTSVSCIINTFKCSAGSICQELFEFLNRPLSTTCSFRIGEINLIKSSSIPVFQDITFPLYVYISLTPPFSLFSYNPPYKYLSNCMITILTFEFVFLIFSLILIYLI